MQLIKYSSVAHTKKKKILKTQIKSAASAVLTGCSNCRLTDTVLSYSHHIKVWTVGEQFCDKVTKTEKKTNKKQPDETLQTDGVNSIQLNLTVHRHQLKQEEAG